MIIELATLPPVVQQYIQQNQSIELKLINNEVVITAKKKVERPFNFDIEEMDKAINSGFKPMPKFNSDEEFLAWVNA